MGLALYAKGIFMINNDILTMKMSHIYADFREKLRWPLDIFKLWEEDAGYELGGVLEYNSDMTMETRMHRQPNEGRLRFYSSVFFSILDASSFWYTLHIRSTKQFSILFCKCARVRMQLCLSMLTSALFTGALKWLRKAC